MILGNGMWEKKMLKKKKRIDEFDIAKGIAIIAMIIGHLGMKHINMIVYAFHMPLFFIGKGSIYTFYKEEICWTDHTLLYMCRIDMPHLCHK